MQAQAILKAKDELKQKSLTGKEKKAVLHSVFCVMLRWFGTVSQQGNIYSLTRGSSTYQVERFLDGEHLTVLIDLLAKLVLLGEFPELILPVEVLFHFTDLAGMLSIFKSSHRVEVPQKIKDLFERISSPSGRKKFEIDFNQAQEIFSKASQNLKATVAKQIDCEQALQSENDKFKTLALRLIDTQKEKLSVSSQMQALKEFERACDQMRVIFGRDFADISVQSSIPRLTDLQNQNSDLGGQINVLQKQHAEAQILVSEAVLAKKRADDAFSAASKESQNAKKRMDEIVRIFNRSKLGL
jgi:hypothetical protein